MRIEQITTFLLSIKRHSRRVLPLVTLLLRRVRRRQQKGYLTRVTHRISINVKLVQILKNIKLASFVLSQKKDADKNNFLRSLAKIILREKKNILSANGKDIVFAKQKNLSKAFIDRLKVGEHEIKRMLVSLTTIQKMEDPIGRIIEEKRLDSGLLLQKLRVPLGVILAIYESRPEVTIDVASLCIKSGNGVILKGGKEALNTNRVLYSCIRQVLKSAKFPEHSIAFILEKSDIGKLVKLDAYIDLVIARGGYEMVKSVMDISEIPVLAHAGGGARIYVDKSADLKMAERIIVNAKISKPAACNSLDTILVHQDIAREFVSDLIKKLQSLGVEVRWGDFGKEFLDLIVSIKIVKDVDSAIEFIHKYTKHHTEGIVAKDRKVIDKFTNSIDAAALFINCSTRLHDGGIFGMGMEMGIATGKLHARGPVGLTELTTYKWIAKGSGQIRE